MLVFRQVLIALNLLLALVFAVDCLVVDSPKVAPRTKARIGAPLGVLFFAVTSLLLVYGVLSVLLKRSPIHLVLLVYVMIPFAIGRFVRFRTLRFYAALQLFAFLLCAATICYLA